MALLVPWAANAQETVTIGEGTSTDNYTPIGTYYNYSITEQLYTAEEIGMAGTISSISFNYASSTAKDFPITVYMMHTDAENLSTGISLADADVVFEGTYSVTGTGWMTITLDSPFAYDGTSNLLIGINKGYVYYYSGNTWYHTTTNAVMARYTQQDGSAYTTSTIPGTTRTARPNIRMEITPGSGPSCAKPSGLAVETNALNAVFTWNSEATSFDIAHSMDATADPNNCIVGQANTTSYEFANLALGDHYVWVRANCGNNDYSDWSAKKSFHIGYCVPAPSSVDNNGISNVTFGMGDYVVNNDTPKATYADYSNLVGAVQQGVESTIAITFKTSYTYNTYVWVDLDNSLSFDADEVVCYGESTSSNPTTLTLSFVIPTTQALGDFALRIGSADSGLGSDPTAADPCYTGTYGCFQDYTLRVLEAPSCLTPTGLAVSNVTGHAATISWTSDAEAWQVQLGENAAIDVTEPTYTFTGLAPETTFSVKVRTDCGGTYSDWTSPVSFTTGIACPAPTVAVNNITTTTAEVSCTNTDAVFFNVMLGEEVVAENVTMPYTLTDLTPDQSYTVMVKALCGGEDGESAWSSGVTFTTAEECPDGMICIGTGKSTNNYLPTYTYYNYSFTQQIYTAEEIGGAGAIMSIDFYMTTSQCTRNLDIYMVMTEQANFASNTDYIAVTESDLVYSGDVTFLQNDWTTIQLNKPFAYDDDTKNVALMVVDQTGGYTSSSSSFRAFTATGGALRVYNDYNTYDPSNPGVFTNPTNSTTSYTFTKLDVKNRVRLVMGEIIDCDMPTNLAVANITMETANLTWTAGGSETAWQVCINGDEENLIDVTNNAYQMTGLTAATTYTVKVRANCGESQSYWTPEISFNTALCDAADQCEIYYDFSGSTSTTWHSASIDVVDVETNLVLATLTYDQPTGSVTVCDGREIKFVYHPASPVTYNQYNAFTFTDLNEEVIFSGVGTSSMTTATVLATYTVNCTPITCPKPIDLVAGTPDVHSVELSWTEKGEATAWQLCLNGDEENLIDVTENPYTLNNLADGTTYTVKVRAFCSSDDQSDWSTVVTFTTEQAFCINTVENLQVSNITASGATLNWEGSNDNYAVRIIATPDMHSSFEDDFENGLGNWTTIDADGDGFVWQSHINTGESNFNTHSGVGVAYSESYSFDEGAALTPDNYLVSPQVELGHTISFWACAQDAAYAAEHFGVAVSTTGNTNAADFTTIQEWTMTAKSMGGKTGASRSGNREAGTYYLYTVDLSEYAGQMGYIAIRHFGCTDMFYLNIDDFTINDFDWTEFTTSETTLALTELDDDTEYAYQMRGYCEDEDLWSDWTEVAYFNTLININTGIPNITPNYAWLTWEGNHDNYRVRYAVVADTLDWNTVETNGTGVVLEPLTPETDYVYQMQGYHNEKGIWTRWTDPEYFTTPTDCLNPENLDVVVGATNATVSWTGVQGQAYQVTWISDAGSDSWTGYEFSHTFENLEPNTWYDFIVAPMCNEELAANTGISTGLYWNDPTTWGNNQVPDYGANAVIPAETVVIIQATPDGGDPISVGEITFNEGSSIVIEEGGELMYGSNEPVPVTMSFGGTTPTRNRDGGNNLGYRLISTPVYEGSTNGISVEATQLMADFSNSDLYSFDHNYPAQEWRNYKANSFSTLDLGKGYLYYADPMFGMFVGNSLPSSVDYTIPLDYNSDIWTSIYEGMSGLNLLGNPYTCRAYPNRPFYLLNENPASETGWEFITSTNNYVMPMNGFFVVAEGENEECELTTTEPTNYAALGINLNQGQNKLDVAVLRFDAGKNLDKIQLDPNHTKLYMTRDNKDFAVLQAEEEKGEMPVNFKAQHNGTYTLSFDSKNVMFSYLRLIDNLTGVETNLLETPSYSFEAKTTDYASRFRLVYATGSSIDGDSFGFINGMGNLTVYGIEGEATLQVMDALGRIISSDQFSGSYEQKLNVAPGVYMIRLIQGNDVKVQKMIVR